MKKLLAISLMVLLIGSFGFNSVLAKTVTLKFMGWEASPLETKSVQEGLARFMKENPDIKVEYTPVPGDQYASKLLTMMAGKAAPDVFFLYAEGYYRDFQKRGVLLDLTGLFNESMKLNDFIPMDRQKMLIRGHIYGVSSCVVAPVLYYNKAVFDKAGLAYPPADPEEAWTWDQFVNISKKLTITDGAKTEQWGCYGFEITPSREAVIYSNEGKIFNPSYTKTVFDKATQEALQKIRDLKVKDKVSPSANFLQQSGMSAAQMLQTGKVAMVADGSWALQQLAKMNFPVGVGALPKLKKPATAGTAHLHCIWKETKYPKEAWKLLQFLSSEDYQVNLVREGLWMPNRTSLYTAAGIKKWLNPAVHPKGFEKLVPYFTKDLLPTPSLFIPREAWDVCEEEFDRFFDDNQPLNKVVPSLRKRVDAILAANAAK